MRAGLFEMCTEEMGLEWGRLGRMRSPLGLRKRELWDSANQANISMHRRLHSYLPVWHPALDFLSAASHTNSLFVLVIHPSIQVMVLWKQKCSPIMYIQRPLFRELWLPQLEICLYFIFMWIAIIRTVIQTGLD